MKTLEGEELLKGDSVIAPVLDSNGKVLDIVCGNVREIFERHGQVLITSHALRIYAKDVILAKTAWEKIGQPLLGKRTKAESKPESS